MPEDRPQWWQTNERLRRDLDLPDYQPPQFRDGTFVHSVVFELESSLECTIRIGGNDLNVGDPWPVIVDGIEIGSLPRHRNQSGNTVYECDADTLRTMVTSAAE
jgi:hypothetical protein